MTDVTSGIGHNQALQGLDGVVHRVPAISLVGKGVDGEDQTAVGELAWGKGPPTASTEMEVDIPDGKRSPEISPVQKGPIQSLMVTPRISWHIQLRCYQRYQEHSPMQRGEWGNIHVYDGEPQGSRRIPKHQSV
jgi:hypothetical protein